MTITENYLLLDDDGTPSAFVDMDAIQAQGTRLAFDLAARSDDPDELDRITAAHLAEAGPRAFGYVAAAALRCLVANVLEPVLEVTTRLHDVGGLHHDLRAGLADAADNARRELA